MPSCRALHSAHTPLLGDVVFEAAAAALQKKRCQDMDDVKGVSDMRDMSDTNDVTMRMIFIDLFIEHFKYLPYLCFHICYMYINILYIYIYIQVIYTNISIPS